MAENLSDWLRLVIPEETANLIRNPSFEESLDTWDDSSTGATRVVGGRFGAWAAQFTAVAANNALITDYNTVSEGGDYTATAHVEADSNEVIVELVAVGVTLASVAHSGSGKWEDLTVTLPTTAAQNLIVRIKDTRTSGWTPIKVDGVQLERKSYATTYCDGDQAGCRWVGTHHLSRSIRAASVRQGGRARTFADLGLKVRSMAGAGMVPVQNVIQAYATRHGAQHQGTSVPQRVLTLVCVLAGGTPDGLHQLRQLLISSMTRPRGKGDPLYLEYIRGNASLRLSVHYEGGMEFGDQTANFEQVPLRFIAPQPYWESLYDDAVELTAVTQSALNTSLARRTVDGDWEPIGNAGQPGDNITSITAIKYAPDGTLWVGGTFTTIGGVTVSNVAYFDGDTWHRPLASDFVAGAIRDFAFKANGRVLIVGQNGFYLGVVNAIAVEYIPETNTHGATYPTASTVGLTGTATAEAAAYSPIDGTMRLAGNLVNYSSGFGVFEDNPGVVVSGDLTGGTHIAYAVAFDESGSLYVGGNFTAITGVSALNVAKLPYGATAWQPMGAGLNGTVYDLKISKSGVVYAAGDFTFNGGAARGAAYFDGNSWQPLGYAFGGGAYDTKKIAIDPLDDKPIFLTNAGTAYNTSSLINRVVSAAYRQTTTLGDYYYLTNLYRWGGTDWSVLDFAFIQDATSVGGDALATRLAFSREGELAVGGVNCDDGFIYPPPVTLEVDAPTPVHVKFLKPPSPTLVRTAYFVSVKNLTTGVAIRTVSINSRWFGNIDINTDADDAYIRSQSGDLVLGLLTDDTSLSRFELVPGENRITGFFTDVATFAPPLETTSRCVMNWRERFHSVDAETEE